MNEPRLDLDHVEVDVEPLGDPRWTRIERGMFTKLERPQAVGEGVRVFGRRLWIGGACALATAAAVTILVGRSSVGTRSSDPVRLVTTEGPSRFTIGESSLWIAPSSLVLVSGSDEHGVDVVLDRGTVTCEVAPRHGRPPFVVDAGEVRVQVVGTRFTVTRGSTETSVGVDHGVVEVAVGGVVTVLHDGERWPAPAGASVGSPSVGGLPAGPAGGGAARGSFEDPVSPSEPPLPGAPTDGPSAVTHLPPSLRRIAPPGASPSTSSAPSPAESTMGSASPPSGQQVFESAARIERTRPDEAAALYRQLVSADAAWSASALFALGRLEADRGHHAEATHLLEEYLARYPRGINVDDARVLLQRLR